MEGKRFKCEGCGKILARTSYYFHKKKHQLENSGDPKIKPTIMFACNVCSLLFDGKNSLEAHSLSHEKNGDEKAHICETCHKGFATSSQLSKHRRCHTGNRRFVCIVCSLGFTRKHNLSRHLLTHGSQKYKCLVCNVGYANEINLKHHQRKHEDVFHSQNLKAKVWKSKLKNSVTSKEPIKNAATMKQNAKISNVKSPNGGSQIMCSNAITKRVYKGLLDLQMSLKHLKLGVTSAEGDVSDAPSSQTSSDAITVVNETDITSFPVPPIIENRSVTVIVTQEKIIINLNISENSDKPVSEKPESIDSENCEESHSENEESIQASTMPNNQSGEDEGNFVEESTEDATTAMSNSQNHMVDHESYVDNTKTTQIEKVMKSLNYQKIIRRDVVKHVKDGKVSFTCNRCDFNCSDLLSMKMHVKSQAHKTFTCRLCGKLYHNQTLLKRHLRIHSGEKPYQCEICDKRFVCVNGLQVHRMSHSSERPHHCSICGKGFSNTGARNEHERIHTGEKRHQCETCGKNFTHRATLKRHIVTHSDERPFKCEECPKAFALYFLLKQHSTIHTGEKRFKCIKCGKAFRSSSHLSRHKRGRCRSMYFSLHNVNVVDKEEPDDNVYKSYNDNEGNEVANIELDVESADSNMASETTFENQTTESLGQENNVSGKDDDGIAIPMQEVVVSGRNVTVESSDLSDSLYQCTGCLSTFTELETAANHECFNSDIGNEAQTAS